MLFPDLPLQVSPRLSEMARVSSLMARLLERTQFDPFNGCWLCEMSRAGPGPVSARYPRVWDGRRRVRASHVAYEWRYGALPAGLHALHRCDAPNCINPGHLFAGSHADNMADAAAKGRKAKKLDICAVRHILVSDAKSVELANRYGVSYDLVRRIRRGESWSRLFLEVSNGS